MITRVTASDIVSAIGSLPRNQVYHYVNADTSGVIEIIDMTRPEGPIFFKRYNPNKGQTPSNAKNEPISTHEIWRVANAFRPSQPINFID